MESDSSLSYADRVEDDLALNLQGRNSVQDSWNSPEKEQPLN